MNLATLVSSLVLAASTATAGLLVSPFHAAPQDGGSGPSLQAGPLCIGVCGNGTSDNGTAPPSDNQTAPPPSDNETAPPADNEAASETCGVDIHDGEDVEGPADYAWSWDVGNGTQNLTVVLEASGGLMPFGSLHARLTDGNGNVVATADDGSMGLTGYAVIQYQGDASTGLVHGTWHLQVHVDGLLGGIWLDVHSAC